MPPQRRAGKGEPEDLRQRIQRDRRTRRVGGQAQDGVARVCRAHSAFRDLVHQQRRLARTRAAD
jgi:hypothetical protein